MATVKRTKAAAYLRMSTSLQEKSPERQREQVAAYARQKGYVIVRWYEDKAMKGSDVTRPGFQSLLRDAQDGQFEVILADELSRLARLGTVDYFVKLVAPLSEADVLVDTVSGGLLVWEEDDLASAVMGAIQRYKPHAEVVEIGERTAKGLFKLALESNLFVGPRPFGMAYSLDDHGNRTGYVPGPTEEVEVVRSTFRQYVNGRSLADIAEDMNQRGIVTRKGKRWTRSSVHVMLTNLAYVGDYVFGRVARGKYYRLMSSDPQGHTRRRKKRAGRKWDIERTPKEDWFLKRDAHQGIIDRVLFDNVQALLLVNRKHTSPSRPRGNHPLSGLLYCPGCNHVMYGTTRKLKERVQVYVCGRYIRNRECEGYWVREDEALISITQALVERFANREAVERLKVALGRRRVDNADEEQAWVEQLRQQAARLDSQIAQAMARLVRVPEDMFDGYLAEVRKMEAELASVQSKLACAAKPVVGNDGVDALAACVTRLTEVITEGNSDLIHELLKCAVERVDLTFRVIPLKKNKRFVCEEGKIRLRKSSLLSETGRDRR